MTPTRDEIRILFDGPPDHESGRFVEVEDADGHSIKAGTWHERADGIWELRITRAAFDPTKAKEVT